MKRHLGRPPLMHLNVAVLRKCTGRVLPRSGGATAVGIHARLGGAHRKLVGVVFCYVFLDYASCFDFDRGSASQPSQVLR